MTGLATILRKEFKNFASSGVGAFALYAVISILWSYTLLNGAGWVWLVFLAVMAAANFSATVFISERISGTLEVLITSGVSRDAVLFGKMLFVIAMTLAMGAACAALAHLWPLLLPEDTDATPLLGLTDAALYLGATVLNAAAGAYLTARMGNPRFLHFVNFLITAGLVVAYDALFWSLTETRPLFVALKVHPFFLAAAFLAIGLAFALLARREFAGERIIRPVIF